ncbi:MAG: mechanosensitive ion channel family protein [Oleiphilaceae bacterium]|nr:mechanosensitive ion channel family protein [Oleiphilaceae bacterium]
MLETILETLGDYKLNVALTALLVIIYLLFRFTIGPRIRAKAEHGRLKDDAITKALWAFNIILTLATISMGLIIWGFDFKGLLTISASIMAVTGVALFAGWSILSNITAFFVLVAHASFRRGNYVRILEGDNYIEGYISEINLFNTKLVSENREVVIYPNNLLLSRPTVVNPREHLNTAGKLPPPVAKEAEGKSVSVDGSSERKGRVEGYSEDKK